MDAKPKIHVVFNCSAAGTVRQSLERVGPRECVIGLLDNLSFGPIDPPSPRLRQEWIGNSLNYDFEEVVQMSELFWTEVTSGDALPVAWVCRADAAEYSGFLEFVWRMAGAPFLMIDVTGLKLTNKAGQTKNVTALGIVTRDQMVEARLCDRQAAPRLDEIGRYRELWGRLRKENAPLRVVDETGLVSAPITYFDNVLVACATDEWQKGARVVGEAMGKLWEGPLSPHVSDLLLWARVCSLGEEGVLEVDGDDSSIRTALVRRAQTTRSAPPSPYS